MRSDQNLILVFNAPRKSLLRDWKPAGTTMYSPAKAISVDAMT